jgi:hypothetical protein
MDFLLLLDAGGLVLLEGIAVLVLAVLLFSHCLLCGVSNGKAKFSCRKEENAFTKQFIESAHFSPSKAMESTKKMNRKCNKTYFFFNFYYYYYFIFNFLRNLNFYLNA